MNNTLPYLDSSLYMAGTWTLVHVYMMHHIIATDLSAAHSCCQSPVLPHHKGFLLDQDVEMGGGAEWTGYWNLTWSSSVVAHPPQGRTCSS